MSERAQPADLRGAVAATRDALTPKLRQIADFVLRDAETFIRSTSRGICGTLGTSEPTLIRFCRHFGYAGLSDFRIDLALAHAKDARGGFVEPLAHDRRQVNLLGKRAIAGAATALIEGDRSLLIDNGSTAEVFAQALGDAAPLTIMTTGLLVAQHALAHGHHTVMLPGGHIRPNALTLTGRLIDVSLVDMHFDTFVMGADSVDPDAGLSCFLEEEARATLAMVEAAGRVIVLADHRKLMKPSLHRVCGLDRVDALVTDLGADDERVRRLIEAGTKVVTAQSRTPAEPEENAA